MKLIHWGRRPPLPVTKSHILNIKSGYTCYTKRQVNMREKKWRTSTILHGMGRGVFSQEATFEQRFGLSE